MCAHIYKRGLFQCCHEGFVAGQRCPFRLDVPDPLLLYLEGVGLGFGLGLGLGLGTAGVYREGGTVNRPCST